MQIVMHNQRHEQVISDFENFPPLDWAKVDQNLKLEGTFMFGGQLKNGDPCGDLYILR